MLGNIPDGTNPTKDQIIKIIHNEREILLKSIIQNLYTDVSEKYLWRILPFNIMCNDIIATLKELKIDVDNNTINEIKLLQISMKEIEEKYCELKENP